MARLISTSIDGTLSVNGSTILNDLQATTISGNGALITNIQWDNIDNKSNIIAGDGLTGGGSLDSNITINIVSADDGIVVTQDDIRVNTVDDLVTDSISRPLSAKQGKALQDAKVDKTTTVSVGGGLIGGGSLSGDITISHPGSSNNIAQSIPNVVTGLTFSNGHVSAVDTYNLDDRYYTEAEVDNKFSELSSGVEWKASVPTFEDIAIVYPTPEDGWTVNVDDTDYTYRYTGTSWIAISANSIPLATALVDGKMSKEYASKLNGIEAGANKYVHPNHTGDVTSTRDGETVISNGVVTETKIANNAVTTIKIADSSITTNKIFDSAISNSKMANMPTKTIKGNDGSTSLEPQDLTAEEVRAMINVADGANKYVHPNHTGDITSTGDGATIIGDGKVTNAKLSNMEQNTIKGRVSATTGNPEDLTAAQVRSMINVANGAEVNQNAFSVIKVGANQALATSKTDTIEFAAGSNISLAVDSATKKLTIANTYSYTHPTFTTDSFTKSTNATSANVVYSITTNNGHVTGGTYKTIVPGTNISLDTSVQGEIRLNNTYSYTHPSGDGNLHVPATGTENNGKFLMAGPTEGELLWSEIAVATTTKAGLLNKLSGAADQYMNGLGQWSYLPPQVTYSEYSGTNAGLVPNGNALTSIEKTTKFLRADGAWEVAYILPNATSSVLGGVKIGEGVSISNGTISVPVATDSTSGLFTGAEKVKLSGIDINANNYSHPTPARSNTTTSTPETPQPGQTFNVIDAITSTAEGHITVVNTKKVTMPIAKEYTLPPATKSTLGGVIVGDNINVDASGKISIANYEPAFTKNTAFNKNFGTTAGTVAEGNHTHNQLVGQNYGSGGETPAFFGANKLRYQMLGGGTQESGSTKGGIPGATWSDALWICNHGNSATSATALLFSKSSDKVGFRRQTRYDQATWGAYYEFWHTGNFDPATKANTTRAINTSGSISGGGNLTADRTITHLTTTGHKHIPAGGAANQWLKWSADGTAAWTAPGVLIKGSFLTGSNYDGNAGTTWAVDATAASTANKVVARDASGYSSFKSIRSELANQTGAITGAALAYRTTAADGHIRFTTDMGAVKTLIGLNNVNNWGASSDIDANSATQYATTSMVAQVRNELVKNPGFIKKITGLSDSYRKFVIGILDVENSPIGKNSHFSGKIVMNRTNGISGPVMLDVSMSKRYNTERINFSGLYSGATFSQVTPCTFTYDGKKYGGFDVFVSNANVHYVELYGVLNGCHEPIVVEYYNTQNDSIIDAEVNSSIKKDVVSYDNDMFKNQHSVYHTGNKPTKDDVGLNNVPNTVHTTTATANTVAVRDGNADLTARFFRSAFNDETRISGAIAYRVNNSTDNSIRYCSDPAAVRAWLNVEQSLPYVKKTGDTMSGGLKFDISSPATYDIDSYQDTPTGSKKYMRRFRGGIDDTVWHETVQGSIYRLSTGASDDLELFKVDHGNIYYKNNAVYHIGNKPTKADVGLSAINNWGASSSINANSTTEYATTNMVAQVKALVTDAAKSPGYIQSGTLYGYNNNLGTLVRTNIPTANNTMVNGKISGNSYGGADRIPFNIDLQFYNYNDNNTILNSNGTSVGIPVPISVFCYQGFVCLWFKQTANFQSFQVELYTGNSTSTQWTATMSNAAEPTVGVTRRVVINPKRVYSEAYKPSSTDVGLGNVNNWGASNDGNNNSTTTYATTAMVHSRINARVGNVNNWGASSNISSNSTYEYATTNMVHQVRNEPKVYGSNNTVTYGWNGMQISNFSGPGGSGAANSTLSNPTHDWYHHATFNHSNASGFYVDLAMCFHSSYYAFRRVVAGVNQGWDRIVTEKTKYVDGPLLHKTANYFDDTSLRNLNYAGFYRTNGADGLSPLMIHCPHSSGVAHGGAIGFDYASYGTYRHAWNASGGHIGKQQFWGQWNFNPGSYSNNRFSTRVVGIDYSGNDAMFEIHKPGVISYATSIISSNRIAFVQTNGGGGWVKTLFQVDTNGYTYSGRTYNAVWNDYAEYFPKKFGYQTEPGDIIALSQHGDTEVYELATENHTIIVGAHSDCYGHLIGGEEQPDGDKGTFEEYNSTKYIPVGLVGRLAVKFIGEAKKGMKVVPSHIPGVGREFNKEKDDYDKVIGYIVENNFEEGIRRVKIKIGK